MSTRLSKFGLDDARIIQLPATGKWLEHQASGDRLLQKILQVRRKFILIEITDGEEYIRKFDDTAKNFKPQSEEEHEFYNQVLNSLCAQDLVKYPTSLQEFPLNVAMWSQVTIECLWASFWLTEGHEDFKRMAMN